MPLGFLGQACVEDTKDAGVTEGAPAVPTPVFDSGRMGSAQAAKNECDGPPAPFTCWIIGSKTVSVFDTITRNNGEVLQCVGWNPFKAKRSATVDKLLSSINEVKPTVLWVHLDSAQAYAHGPLQKRVLGQLAAIVAKTRSCRQNDGA